MRYTSLIFTFVFFLAGCGSKGALFLPKGKTVEVQPVSIEEVQPVSIEEETFQPETEQQKLQNQDTRQEEEEDE